MTDGSSQGLFVVVGVVIFGIFISISYVLFNDTLKPALANIFNESIYALPEPFFLMGTKRGVEYESNYSRESPEGFEEYRRISEIDLSYLGDKYPHNTIYEITFSIKNYEDGKLLVYAQNGDSYKYQMFTGKYLDTFRKTIDIKKSTEYVTYKFEFILQEAGFYDEDEHKGTSYLSFYTGYGSRNKFWVKDISIKKVGVLN